jgi:hypothetical protein
MVAATVGDLLERRQACTVGSAGSLPDVPWLLAWRIGLKRGGGLVVSGFASHLLAEFEHFPEAASDLAGFPLFSIRRWLLNRFYDSWGLPSSLAD